MTDSLQSSIDAILRKVTSGSPRVAGVVAIATDRNGNIYEGAAGKRVLGQDADMTTDSVFAIFSTTKAIAGTAALQLVEDGRLDLDAPAKIYAPDIGKLQVLEGFDDRGQPRLRPPKRDVTTRMLLLHTAGFGYDFFNENYNRLAKEHGQPSVLTATKASINTPLLFDPGDAVGIRLEHRLGRSGRRRHRRPAARRGHGGADLRAARHGRHRLQADACDALAPGADASARGRRLADADDRLRAAAGPGGPHGRPRAVLDRGRLLQVHPHVAERRRGCARAGAEAGDRAGGGEEQPRPHEDQGPARRDPDACRTTRSSSPACPSPGR